MKTMILALGILFAALAGAQANPESISTRPIFSNSVERQAQVRRARAKREPQQIAIGVPMLGGSWLESNLGASRPHGAPGPWCGFAMRKEMVSMGFGDPGVKFNHVSHWCGLGSPAPRGAVGSIFVSRGHVSKVAAGGNCPAGTVHTISGNATARRVSYMCEPMSRAVCFRWPGSVNASR